MRAVSDFQAASAARANSERRLLLRHCAAFLAIGLLLYLGLYAASESLIHRYGQRNPFYQVSTAPHQHFDHVIVGASHAMPFGFDGMNEHLEELTGSRIINLSMEGAGVLPNRLVLDYFLQEHDADNVVYILDSFAFYSRDWNEDRLTDSDLLRAPFDPQLIGTLWSYPWARGLLPNYLSGFAKINNPDRFEPDLSEAELTKFDRVYRPIPQIDRQRIQFLYPSDAGPQSPTFERYFTQFESFLDFILASGLDLTVIKPPTPTRIREMLPDEDRFDEKISTLLARYGFEFHDLAGVTNDPEFFYDSDHLNREGVLAFSENHLAPLLRETD